jgi:hypothetical protein
VPVPEKKRKQSANAEDTARYIASIAAELRVMAARADLGFLAYLLAMVEDDAASMSSVRAEPKLRANKV